MIRHSIVTCLLFCAIVFFSANCGDSGPQAEGDPEAETPQEEAGEEPVEDSTDPEELPLEEPDTVEAADTTDPEPEITEPELEESAPVCDPPCDLRFETCEIDGCVCREGYHDGGEGDCTHAGTCADGYAIPMGGADCLPLEEVCADDLPCKRLTGWMPTGCRYNERLDGTSCEGQSQDPCVTHFSCMTGECLPMWADCAEVRPIVFVHGVNGSSAGWETMAQRLIADGWPPEYLFFFDAADPSWGCNVDNAAAIQALVREAMETTCHSRIDLIAHSMGTLSSRYFVKNLGGQFVVNTYLTLGGMHHGLSSSCWAPDFLNVCIWQEICETGAYVAQLNADPATPGDLWWVSMYGTADATVPNDSSHLNGAENIAFEGVEHDGANGLLQVPQVYEEVKRVLGYECW